MVGFIFSVWGSIIFGVLYGILSFIIAINMIRTGCFSNYSLYSMLSSTNGTYKYAEGGTVGHNINVSDRLFSITLLVMYILVWPVLLLLILFKYLFTDFIFKFISKVTNMVPHVTVKVEKGKSGEKKPEPMHCTDAVPLSEEEIHGRMYADDGV